MQIKACVNSTTPTKQRLAMAQLKLKQLKQKQLVMDEEYRLEIEMHEKNFKTELERLKRMKEIIDAQAEVNKCALESQFSVADECSLNFLRNVL